MDLDFYDRFKNVIAEMQKLGEEYAEAKGQSWNAQELLPSILAQEIKKITTGSIELRKIEAKNSEVYKEAVRNCTVLLKNELTIKAKLDCAKARFEAYRSLSSLEKANRAAT